MNKDFWIKAWNEGRTQFHQSGHHEKLVEHFPKLGAKSGQKVLVPLCGKSKDMLWLHDRGLEVRGIELHDGAVLDFFSENELGAPRRSEDAAYSHHTHRGITLSCGDFFKLDEPGAYDFVYDRAALVALPESMRKDYARVITRALKSGGQYLLIVYEYDPAHMEGPPFSVREQEIRDLYQDAFSIRLIETHRPANDGPRLSAVASLRQSVYILKKR